MTNQIIKIHVERVFWTEVMRWCVCVKLWIHVIAGDTSGHNNLVGHMNGRQPKFIYWDCRCLLDDLSSPIPMCSLITSEELKQSRLTVDGLTNLCKKIISNAFENVPFGDLKYGLLGSVHAEMLHVSRSITLAYSNTCLVVLIIWLEARIWKKKDKESFDDLHRCLVRSAEQQSKRDFPCMSIQNEIPDGTKMCGSKQGGNCFVLLCVMHTHSGGKMMWKEMKDRTISVNKIKNRLKLYLSFECWVNEPHPRSQVKQSLTA